MSVPASARWRVRWTLLSFVVAVLVIRAVTTALHLRGAGTGGGLLIGGVHIHHMLFGLAVLVLLSVAWLIGAAWTSHRTTRPWAPILLGVAWALVLDELALIVNLSDVYWAPLGDESLIGMSVFAVLLLVLAFTVSARPTAGADAVLTKGEDR